MTLEQLGNLGELIGSIGVILSLVYLGRQIQQQNTITRVQFGHSPEQRIIGMRLRLTCGSLVAAIILRSTGSRHDRLLWHAYRSAT